jgi:hypothetical protein
MLPACFGTWWVTPFISNFICVQVLHNGSKSLCKFWISELSVLKPVKEESASNIADPRLLPRECRESVSYYNYFCRNLSHDYLKHP